MGCEWRENFWINCFVLRAFDEKRCRLSVNIVRLLNIQIGCASIYDKLLCRSSFCTRKLLIKSDAMTIGSIAKVWIKFSVSSSFSSSHRRMPNLLTFLFKRIQSVLFSIVHRYELLVPAGTKEKQSKSLGDLLDMVSLVSTNFDVNMNAGHHLCVHRLTMCISSTFRNKQTMWTEMAAAAVATVVVQVHQVPRLKRHSP